MQVTHSLLKVVASLVIVGAVFRAAAGAQNPDSLVRLLGSAS